MSKQYVSLWVGKFNNKNEFISYVFNHKEEMLSSFEQNFNVYANFDFVESGFFTDSVINHFNNIAYNEQLTSKIHDLINSIENSDEFNIFVLLYENEYNGETKEIITNNNILKFVGNIAYNL